MFEIRPNCLYSRDDLRRELGDLLSLETFLGVVEPLLPAERKFKSCYWGSDLIAALDTPKPKRTFASVRPTSRRRQPRLAERIHFVEKKL